MDFRPRNTKSPHFNWTTVWAFAGDTSVGEGPDETGLVVETIILPIVTTNGSDRRNLAERCQAANKVGRRVC